MDLIRGKTFIKSYAQNPPEKVPSICPKVKKNVDARGNVGECVVKKNELGTQRTLKKTYMNEEEYRPRKFITKSKTHDCVSRQHKLEGSATRNGKGRLSSSISFPQVESYNRKGDDSYIVAESAYRQPMIDYRNFAPLMPFVPSVAKSLPKKRISLKRSKRGLRDIFSLKKNKQEYIISTNERLEPCISETKEGGKVGKKHLQEMDSDEILTVELSDNEMHMDTVESCHMLCEDVASLKSFDSLTGCGEIFADESSAYIEFENGKDGPKVKFITKPSPLAVNFQGGVEKLASPAKSETIDFSRLCRQTCTSARSFRPNSLIDSKLLPKSNFVFLKENNGNISGDQVPNSTYNDLVSSSDNVTDAGSPISTSDEGYYDSFSHGTDDNKKEIEAATAFPQNSYSGDALYELFCDSKVTKLTTALDNETPPLSEPNTDNDMSVYSFCVESEEKLASQPDNDLVGDSISQSSWKGRECFLKLCDTELTLTMGLVNWLKKTSEVTDHQVTHENVSNNQHEAPVKSLVEDSSKSLSVCNRTANTQEDTQLIAQICKKEGHGDIYVGNDSAHLQSGIFSEGPSIHREEPLSKKISENQVSLLNTLPGEGKTTKDLSNQQVNILTTMGYMHFLTGTDIFSGFKNDNQKTLNCLDLQYLTGCVSPSLWGTDKKMVQIIEQCATQVASMHINHEVKSDCDTKNMCIKEKMYAEEESKNVKNSLELCVRTSKGNVLHPPLSKYTELTNKHLERTGLNTEELPANKMNPFIIDSKKDSHYDHIFGPACTLKEHASSLCRQKTRTPWFTNKATFLPFFGSHCPSVMSRCSSTLYKVCNSGETVIFFKSPNKLKEQLNKIEGLTQDSSGPFHTESSKNKIDGYQAITGTGYIGKNGELWSNM